MNSIDLHGFTEQEVYGAVYGAIMSLLPGEELEIITGNGEVIKDVVLEILNEENLDYRFEGSNYGAIIIKK